MILKLYIRCKIILPVILLSILSANDTLQVDIENSQINWIGRKVTGEHNGTLNLIDSWVVVHGANLIGGKFIFDMATITNSDIESPAWKLKLENHLKNDDFFNVDSFPQAILEIKSNKKLPEQEKQLGLNHLKGELTIRGITHEIHFPYKLDIIQSSYNAHGSVNIDRTLFNVKYGSGKFFDALGDKLIYDDFTVQFKVITQVKQAR